MKFEIFSGKLQNAVNVLETYGRRMHNEDIVFMMWIKLRSADLSIFLSSIKVNYRHNRQNYTEILQEIAMQIPTTKSQLFSPTGVYEPNRVEGRGGNRSDGDCPASGAHMADGAIYTVSYLYKQWISKEVVRHHDTIRANCK